METICYNDGHSQVLLDGKETKNSNESSPLLKVLVPNSTAGALIGKGGANISELQNKFGCTIHLSPNGQCYPGTSERIVVMRGDSTQIINMNNHVMEKVHADLTERSGDEGGRVEQVKIVLTNSAAGLLIGHGGVTVKAIQEETKAKIMITNREESVVPGERVLTVSGSMEQRMEACRHVVEKIGHEDSNMRNNHFRYSTNVMDTGTTYIAGPARAFHNKHSETSNSYPNSYPVFSTNSYPVLSTNTLYGEGVRRSYSEQSNFATVRSPNHNYKSSFKTNVQIQVEVPDILVGAILGKQGQTVLEFIQYSGANIKFSEKNEFVPGTTNRTLTITGDMKQTETAYFLISQRVEQAQNELYAQF